MNYNIKAADNGYILTVKDKQGALLAQFVYTELADAFIYIRKLEGV